MIAAVVTDKFVATLEFSSIKEAIEDAKKYRRAVVFLGCRVEDVEGVLKETGVVVDSIYEILDFQRFKMIDYYCFSIFGSRAVNYFYVKDYSLYAITTGSWTKLVVE